MIFAYTLALTRQEIGAIEFANGRYEWPNKLMECLNVDTLTVEFTETDMWEWNEDVNSDDWWFPLAAPSFQEKLTEFLGQMV